MFESVLPVGGGRDNYGHLGAKACACLQNRRRTGHITGTSLYCGGGYREPETGRANITAVSTGTRVGHRSVATHSLLRRSTGDATFSSNVHGRGVGTTVSPVCLGAGGTIKRTAITLGITDKTTITNGGHEETVFATGSVTGAGCVCRNCGGCSNNGGCPGCTGGQLAAGQTGLLSLGGRLFNSHED